MITDLHVLSNGELLETFRLEPGIRLLGSGPGADLVLSAADAPAEACRVELDFDGKVHLRTRDETLLRASSGLERPALELENGDWAEIHGLRLLLLVTPPPREVTLDVPRSEVPTAPSTGVKPPIRDTLGLKIRAFGRMQPVRLDAPQLTFGRGPGNQVSFVHGEVSRTHARLFRKPGSVWIEDLNSAHGTFLNGIQLKGSAEWPLGGRVTLSAAPDAPMIELVPLVEALAEASTPDAVQPLVGRGEEMQMLRAQVLRHGENDHTVLLLGESGTGKELVANALAALRAPGGKPIAVHSGALPESLVEAELFGHKKGAFTGAVQDRAGAFEAAGKGTIFLDEIGELPLPAQAKLLRVLEAREITRVGENQARPMRARVVAATNRDLAAMVRAGTFREDLFHRLNVIAIRLPPLRAHLEDIPDLVRSFLLARKGKSAGKILSDGAMKKLLTYLWPGNVRELRNTLERAAANCDGVEIPPEALEFTETTALEDARAARTGVGEGPDRVELFERELCLNALAQTKDNVIQAARLVGKSETSFRRCLVRHGLLPAPRGGTT